MISAQLLKGVKTLVTDDFNNSAVDVHIAL